jgi:phage baseplate assembly protein W
MLPQQNLRETAVNIISPLEQPSKTYHWDIKRGRIRGHVDGLEAMKQAIYKTLTTERYKYVIYSRNYGVELANLLGTPKPYACSEIKRRVTEALLWDKRITAVDGWVFDTETSETVKCKFIAHTIFGDAEIDDWEVAI